jgi:putative flippase GtrA
LPVSGVQYARFSLVGTSNALVDLGTMNLLLLVWPTRSPGMLVLYNLVALTTTNANSYLWNTLWTFKRRSHHGAKQVVMFAAQAALSVGVSTLVLWMVAHGLAGYANLPPLVGGNMAKLSSMLVGSTTSFFLLRYLVFRPRREGRHYRGPGELRFSPLDRVSRSCRRTGLRRGTKRGTSSR